MLDFPASHISFREGNHQFKTHIFSEGPFFIALLYSLPDQLSNTKCLKLIVGPSRGASIVDAFKGGLDRAEIAPWMTRSQGFEII